MREVTPNQATSRPTGQASGTRRPKKPKVEVFGGLDAELARIAPLYRSRRTAHAALAPYETLDTLVEKLTTYTDETRDERIALVCVLVDLYRTTRHRVWSTVLLRVFRPMLNKVRGSLEGHDAEELDGALLASFFEALEKVDTAKYRAKVPMFVRSRTRRYLFQTLGYEADWETFAGDGVDCEEEVDPVSESEPLLIGVWLEEEKGDAESIELVRTLFDRGGLWALVRQRLADRDPSEQRLEYRRLQSKRHRLVQRFRHRLRDEVGPHAPISPRPPHRKRLGADTPPLTAPAVVEECAPEAS